jgi:hypothetical protein
VGDALVATEGAGPVSSASPASKKFGFPPLSAPELIFPAALVSSPARPPDPVFKFSPLKAALDSSTWVCPSVSRWSGCVG